MLNKKTIFIILSVSVALLFYVAWTVVGFTQTATADVSFKGRTDKETYILGEPISVELEFNNTGENPVKVISGGVDVGSLKILIAGKDGEYKRYKSEEWGRKRGQKITLEPSKSLKYKQATILWNTLPKSWDLQGIITTEYAFPEPGVYFIKGVSSIKWSSSPDESFTPIESKPIKVIIEAPTGDDLEVWNKIKGNKQIAVLMQRGEITVEKETERQKFAAQAEQISEQFPNSVYSSYLKSKLEKYKVDEIRRNETYKNITRKPE